MTALTLDADDRVTSAIADVTEPALTVSADGTVSAPELMKTKLEQGDAVRELRCIRSGQRMV